MCGALLVDLSVACPATRSGRVLMAVRIAIAVTILIVVQRSPQQFLLGAGCGGRSGDCFGGGLGNFGGAAQDQAALATRLPRCHR